MLGDLVAPSVSWSRAAASRRLWAGFHHLAGGATSIIGSLRPMPTMFCYWVPVNFPKSYGSASA